MLVCCCEGPAPRELGHIGVRTEGKLGRTKEVVLRSDVGEECFSVALNTAWELCGGFSPWAIWYASGTCTVRSEIQVWDCFWFNSLLHLV